MGHIYSKWYLFGNTHGWSCHHWRLIHRVAPDPNPALRSLYWVSQHVSTKTRGTNFTAVLFLEMQHLHSKWHSESQKVALENDSFQTQVPSHRVPMWTPPLHRQRGHTPARFVCPTRGKFRHSTSWSSLVIPGQHHMVTHLFEDWKALSTRTEKSSFIELCVIGRSRPNLGTPTICNISSLCFIWVWVFCRERCQSRNSSHPMLSPSPVHRIPKSWIDPMPSIPKGFRLEVSNIGGNGSKIGYRSAVHFFPSMAGNTANFGCAVEDWTPALPGKKEAVLYIQLRDLETSNCSKMVKSC